MMRGVLPKIASTAGCLLRQKSAGGRCTIDRGHERREHQRRESAPHHAPVAGVAVHLGEDVAEEVGDREEQHAGQEGDRGPMPRQR